jgi:hypothetical protein
MKYCEEGWPGYEKPSIDLVTRPYWQIKEELCLSRITYERKSTCHSYSLESWHVSENSRRTSGNSEVSGTSQKFNLMAWNQSWNGGPHLVKSCSVCVKTDRIMLSLCDQSNPDRTWEMAATDLFHLKNNNYLLVMDYISRFVEIAKLKNTTSQAIINHLKSIFARHIIPDSLVSDNGPQYASSVFQTFF